jgi:hypothetical protein
VYTLQGAVPSLRAAIVTRRELAKGCRDDCIRVRAIGIALSATGRFGTLRLDCPKR